MNYHANSRDSLASIEDTIATLRRKGVRLWVENGTLRYRAKRGSVTSDDLAQLRGSEERISSLLSSFGAVAQYEPRLIKRPHPTCAPLAFSQLAYWNVRKSMHRRPVRQVAAVTHIRGELQIGPLREALSEVVRRHEALRTRVIALGDVPVQEVRTYDGYSIELLNLSGISSTEQMSSVRHCIRSSILDVTDYALDPLFRAVFVELGGREGLLILALDHVISDGVSLNIILSDLLAIYADMMNGRQSSLPPVAMHCIDHALWQRTQLSESLEDGINERADHRFIRFPSDRAEARTVGWGAIQFALGSKAKIALQSWARDRGTTLTMVVLNLYAALVLRWCAASEIVVQVMIDGRTNRLLEQTVGCVAFPLYVRVMIEGWESLADLFEIVTKEYCKAYDHPDFFRSYVRDPVPAFTRNTVFNWLPRPARDERIVIRGESVTLAPVRLENPLLETFECDAEPMVIFEETLDDVIGEVHFSKARFSQHLMQRFIDNFGILVDAFVQGSATGVRDADVMAAAVGSRPVGVPG